MKAATTKRPHPIHAELRDASACEEAREWARGKTPADIWKTCERGDWMLWWAGKCSGPPESDSRKRLVLAACECARLALPIFEKRRHNDDRPRKAIETAERYARGEGATLADVRSYAAYADAAYAAYAASAAYAAYAAYAYAAYAAAAAAAAYAAYADAAYAAAAAAAARASERARVLKECAAIVRKNYPKMPRAAK